MPSQLSIDGVRLREDREKLGLTREALVKKAEEDGLPEFSVSSIRRAESGTATKTMLVYIATALGFAAERYIESSRKDVWHTDFDLNGEWLAFYFEQDVDSDPYIARERLFIQHDKSTIDGIYEPLSTDHPDGYKGNYSFVMKGNVINDMVFGKYYVDRRSHPRGSGVFQLMLMKNGEWAEGFCTFFTDDNLIVASVNIWIKKSSVEFHRLCSQVETFLKKNRGLFIKAPQSVRV